MIITTPVSYWWYLYAGFIRTFYHKAELLFHGAIIIIEVVSAFLFAYKWENSNGYELRGAFAIIVGCLLVVQFMIFFLWPLVRLTISRTRNVREITYTFTKDQVTIKAGGAVTIIPNADIKRINYGVRYIRLKTRKDAVFVFGEPEVINALIDAIDVV